MLLEFEIEFSVGSVFYILNFCGILSYYFWIFLYILIWIRPSAGKFWWCFACLFYDLLPGNIDVGTPPPDDMWHASLSGATPSELPKVGHVARIAIRTILYPDSPRGHVARSSIRTPLGRSTCHSRMSRPNDNISYPDHWLKWASLATSFRQPATAHYLPPAERKDRVGSRSPPTIHRLQCERTGMMASHLPRSLTAAHRVMMALPPPWSHHDKPKSPPLIKEGGRASDTI